MACEVVSFSTSVRVVSRSVCCCQHPFASQFVALSERVDEAGVEDEDDDEWHNHAEDEKADGLVKNEVVKVIAKIREG